jgi:hypothetical protein
MLTGVEPHHRRLAYGCGDLSARDGAGLCNRCCVARRLTASRNVVAPRHSDQTPDGRKAGYSANASKHGNLFPPWWGQASMDITWLRNHRSAVITMACARGVR